MALMYRVKTLFTGESGAPYYNQTYWAESVFYDAAGATSAIHDFWDDMKGLLTSSLTISWPDPVDLVDIDTGAITGTTTSSPSSVVGTNSAPVLPFSTQGLAVFLTGQYVAGRQLIGRMNIPGLCTDSLSSGQFQESNRGDTASRIEALSASGLEKTMLVYSPTHHVVAPITASRVNIKFAVLRSRRD